MTPLTDAEEAALVKTLTVFGLLTG
jgi:hypothetical protein